MRANLKKYWACFYSQSIAEAGQHPLTETAIFTLRRDANAFLKDRTHLAELWRMDEVSGINRRLKYGPCPYCRGEVVAATASYPVCCVGCHATFT